MLRDVVLVLLPFAFLHAQGNYEVQVYGSDLVPPRVTMVELHSNFTARGVKTAIGGVLPTNHADGGWMWVGTHLRPRMAVPERYHLPVGLSLSTEFGYQRPNFSADTWTWEIRPIVDKKLGPWYLCFNPALDKSFHGAGQSAGYEFSPNAKFSYDVTKRVAAGMEYYGGWGPLTGFDPLRDQIQQFLPAIDVDFGPKWEFNFGVGWGVTSATDRLLVKAILGYRFNLRK
ncbi:MAG: hypothetical protein LAQ30_22440 [Acidobacteriia bacterium]|nr:hypothetical protein [Terriglobia bacterium]